MGQGVYDNHDRRVKGGSVHLVQGAYDYCHYMQDTFDDDGWGCDKFDDDGWGCMYRSYQTVISWFRHQHYTALPIQSHEGVQKMLVSMGDKPPRFVGSKQWIGVMEAAILLDQYLGVSCKWIGAMEAAILLDQYLGVSCKPGPAGLGPGSGLRCPDMERAHRAPGARDPGPSPGRGTPISIGGGVLAFTILGVHYNAETSQIKFLVLDPHYTVAKVDE
ncbi:peptidase family C78-domain-containing protein [Baffinella frigidus]|nr:peptidase family C78-domain-containing protein [Cryptophyta sp. CCMP2293]